VVTAEVVMEEAATVEVIMEENMEVVMGGIEEEVMEVTAVIFVVF